MSKVCTHGDEWVYTHPTRGSWCVRCLIQVADERDEVKTRLEAMIESVQNWAAHSDEACDRLVVEDGVCDDCDSVDCSIRELLYLLATKGGADGRD